MEFASKKITSTATTMKTATTRHPPPPLAFWGGWRGTGGGGGGGGSTSPQIQPMMGLRPFDVKSSAGTVLPSGSIRVRSTALAMRTSSQS